MVDEESYCNTALGLGLAIGGQFVPNQDNQHHHRHAAADVSLDLSFALCSKHVVVVDDDDDDDHKANISRSTDEYDEAEHAFAGKKSNLAKNNGRKKLRLTKEQYSLLEDCFKSHSSLNPDQKQILAEKLNLKPRQVEVWFQNRRARTKMKQTEMDCEYLKKCCQDLSDENRRLKKELQELRALKPGNSPVLMQPTKHATPLAMCASCENNCKSQ